MSGLENLIQNKHLDPKNPTKLLPSKYGSYGYLNLGGTTFHTLSSFLKIDTTLADSFTTKRWNKPKMSDARPDALVIKGQSVVAVIEHKSAGELTKKRKREEALEQVQAYVLVTNAKLGIVTDGSLTFWVHNTDFKRRFVIKEIKTLSENYSDPPLAENIRFVLEHLDPITDELSTPSSANPSLVARSVWQSVYIATRQSPERCFQTFVELFMYKLLSDYNLLPGNHQIGSLSIENKKFLSQYGKTQVEYYVSNIRDNIKTTVFPELNTQAVINGVKASGTHEYIPSATLITSLDTNGGHTSIIDGHAFEKILKHTMVHL